MIMRIFIFFFNFFFEQRRHGPAMRAVHIHGQD
jgi:hypothetical protein